VLVLVEVEVEVPNETLSTRERETGLGVKKGGSAVRSVPGVPVVIVISEPPLQ